MRNDDFPGHMVLAQAVGRSDAEAAQSAARQAVAALIDVEPASCIEILRGTGAPSVAVRRSSLRHTVPVALSYAHSGGRAVAVAAASDWKVGIDLEPRGAVHEDARRMFLSPRERRVLSRVDATSAWCMKEAAWKMLECNSATPFHALELSLSGELRLNGEIVRVSVALLRPWSGWMLALTWMRADALASVSARTA
jgi:4'-phosphopantetheinyl transferase EntD